MSEDQSRDLEDEFNATLQHLDELVREFEQLPLPQVRDQAIEMLRTIDAIHREALRRLIAFIHEQGHADLVLRAAHDPIVRTLLILYDFLPGDEQKQEVPESASAFIPIGQLVSLPRHELRKPIFKTVARLKDIPAGTMLSFDVEDAHILVARINGEVYATRNNCPGSAAPLSMGVFTPPIIICPWHNEAWDIRTGRRSDGQPGPNLELFPVSVVDGEIRLAVNVTRSDNLQRMK